MATQVQLRRGTATENNSFTGAQGELTFDTTNKRVRIHDGATAGGFELKTENSSGDTLFADNEKAIFGAGSDLQIYHDGSDSYIDDAGTGRLHLRGNDQVTLGKYTGENMVVAVADGQVELYYDNAVSLSTTSTGADITGTLTSDGLTVDATTSTAVQANADAGYSLFNGATNSSGARINISGGSAANGIAINGYNAAQNGYTPLNYLAADHRFKIGSSEKMRLDASGTVLVGKTASDSDVVGVEAAQDGHVYVTVNNTLPLYINRQSGDELLRFASNGTTVGKIGVTDSGDRIYLAGGGLEGVGIDNGNDCFVPTSETGAYKSGHMSLGRSDARFTDLFLSGSVYLGGTGSANALDDYEEGTWTPAVSNMTVTGTLTTAGRYTKVGRMVSLMGWVSATTSIAHSVSALISGFPFAGAFVTGEGQSRSAGVIVAGANADLPSSNHSAACFVDSPNSRAFLGNFTTTAANEYIYINVVYYTA